MNEMIKLGMTLMIVTLIASLALALTNYYNAPQIEVQKETAVKESLNKVIEAESFIDKKSYFEAYDENGKLVGRVVKIEANGYSSIINFLAGVDLDVKITGVDVVSQQETPGLGAKVGEELFLNQFKGKTMNMLKLKKDGGEIDAITGATISSRAVTDNIKNTIAKYTGEIDAITGATSKAKIKEGAVEKTNFTENGAR